MCEDKRYATLPISMVKAVLNILKTLCTTYIIRTFKINCKVFITTSPAEIGCLLVLCTNRHNKPWLDSNNAMTKQKQNTSVSATHFEHI